MGPGGAESTRGAVQPAGQGGADRDEVAAQAAAGAVRYDIALDAASGRWYLDASWRTLAQPIPSLGDLRQSPVVAVDVNVGHLAVAVIAADGNVLGSPFTVPLELAGFPATTRDGRLRSAKGPPRRLVPRCQGRRSYRDAVER